MPKLEQINPNQQTNQSANQNSTATNQNQTQNQPKGLFSLPPAVMNIVPWIPLMLEMTTGQKIPQMTGTIAEMQMALISIQNSLQIIVNNQNQLTNRIQQLETNANNQLTNLTHQFNSLRLTHTREKKEIEYNPPKLENQEDY